MEICGKTAITGIAELKPTVDPGGRTTLGLLSEVAGLAVLDAGLQKKSIDGLLVTPPAEDTHFMWPAQVAEYLKIDPRFLEWLNWVGRAAAVPSSGPPWPFTQGCADIVSA